jgi:chaperonin cofactor prefoldin
MLDAGNIELGEKMEENYEQRLKKLEKRVEQLENQVRILNKRTESGEISRALGKQAALGGGLL